MEEGQALLGPQPIPAVLPSAVQVVQFFFATSGVPSVGHISPTYTCTRIEKKKKKSKLDSNTRGGRHHSPTIIVANIQLFVDTH
jgi:hypothetical protein